MIHVPHPLTIATLALSLLATAGCSSLFERNSAPINYYVLSPAPAGTSAPALIGGPVYAVAPVRIPQYLTLKSIAIRLEANEIGYAANDQWAGPLADDLTAVLAENLSQMLPSDRVVALPVAPAVPVDFEVRTEVIRFERQPDGTVELVARWMLFAEGGHRLLGMYRSELRRPGEAKDYADVVAAMSDLLVDLARDMASALHTAALSPRVPQAGS